jgi:Fic family protein
VDRSERANYQLFLTELTKLLDLERPTPASQDTENNAYVFERKVRFKHADGSESQGFIDLYRRGCFVCEAKQSGKQLDSDAWDAAMLRAHGQAQQYARALLSHALRHPGQDYTVASHQRSHRVATQTARTDLLALAELQLVERRKRGRAFVFSAQQNLRERIAALAKPRKR